MDNNKKGTWGRRGKSSKNRLIQALEDSPNGLTLDEASEKANVPKSTILGFLDRMVKDQLAKLVGNKYYDNKDGIQ